MVSDGGHDVAEVQGGDGATFVLVFLCKCLAGMFELQLLQQHTQRRGQARSWQKKQRMSSYNEQHRITGEQRNRTLEDESIILSVLDRCARQMWQCQTLAFVITTVPVETNGNHVARSLIPEMSRAVGETAGRCVRRKVIQYDNTAIRCGCRGRLTPGQCLLSKLIKYN